MAVETGENIILGSFDREHYLSGSYAMIGFDHENLFQPGDTVRLQLYPDGESNSGSENPDPSEQPYVTGEQSGFRDGNLNENSTNENNTVEYEVMAFIDTSPLFALSSHYSTMPGYSIYLPASEMQEKYPGGNIMSATILAEEGYLVDLQEQIAGILKDYPDLDFRSRSDYIKEMETENMQTAIIGFTLCGVILFIGILNFANTIMTGIIARRQEIAMLQSMGMTGKQCGQMLIWESLWHLAIVFVLFITAGTVITNFIIGAIADNSAAYTLTPSLFPISLCFSLLILTSILLPQAIFQHISKESVVERLRRAE